MWSSGVSVMVDRRDRVLEAQCHLPSPSARRDARPVAAIRSPHVNWKGYRHAQSGLLRAGRVARCRRERHRVLRASPCRRLPDFVRGGLADPEGPRRGHDRNASADRARRQWLLGGSARPGRPARRKSCLWTDPAHHVGSITRSTRGCGTAAGATSPSGHSPKPISLRTGPAPHCRGQSPCFAARHFRRQLLIRRHRPHSLEPCNGTRRIERFGGFFRPCRPPADQ
jgi:hypothetical protein